MMHTLEPDRGNARRKRKAPFEYIRDGGVPCKSAYQGAKNAPDDLPNLGGFRREDNRRRSIQSRLIGRNALQEKDCHTNIKAEKFGHCPWRLPMAVQEFLLIEEYSMKLVSNRVYGGSRIRGHRSYFNSAKNNPVPRADLSTRPYAQAINDHAQFVHVSRKGNYLFV